MAAWLDRLRDLSILSVCLRMLLAAVCGGAIGIEREYKRRPAGFRTHILICLGAAMTTLTGQYLLLEMGQYTDISRLGAQVVAGIGFIGAGTIIITHRQRVKGLTTAAGLWMAGIIGLSLGAGFYEGGLMATGLLLLAELVFSKWEYRMLDRVMEFNLYVEYRGQECLRRTLDLFREGGLKLMNMEITRHTEEEPAAASVIFTLWRRRRSGSSVEQVVQRLHGIPGVEVVEEL